MDLVCFFCRVFGMPLCASVYLCLVVTCWERTDLFKCLKSLNLLELLSHTSWSADRTTLLKLYQSLVRSKLDYGCIIYGSARKSYLQMLDPNNQRFRLVFRTSVASLYVEADEPSLYSHREKSLFAICNTTCCLPNKSCS